MKILCVSDHIDPVVYSLQIKTRFKDISFVLGCGDLRLNYFDYIISNLNKPLFFVFGNHHLRQLDFYNNRVHNYGYFLKGEQKEFMGVGATCIEGRCVMQDKLLIMGFGGSMRYNYGLNQFTEFGMAMKVLKTIPRLLYNKLRYKRYLDILITHAPPYKIHDQEDRCHQGFKIFRWFIKWFKPRFFIHGHVHLYSKNRKRIDQFHDTMIVNAYDHFILEIEDKL